MVSRATTGRRWCFSHTLGQRETADEIPKFAPFPSLLQYAVLIFESVRCVGAITAPALCIIFIFQRTEK